MTLMDAHIYLFCCSFLSSAGGGHLAQKGMWEGQFRSNQLNFTNDEAPKR